MERLLGRVTLTFKLSNREIEARVQDHSLSLSEFEANLDYTMPFLKNKFPQRREAGFRINPSEVNVNKHLHYMWMVC